MPSEAVFPIHPLREDPIDVAHHPRDVAARRLENEVVMVWHQTHRIACGIVELERVCQSLQESPSVIVFIEDSGLAIAAGHHVVDGTRKLESRTS
jgi:hypothetical protein